MSVLWADAHPPHSFTKSNGREWTYMETTANLLDQLDDITENFHCKHKFKKGMVEGKSQVYKAKFNCISDDPRCMFALMAGKTDRGRFHIYVSGQHTCLQHANGVTNKSLTNDKRSAAGEEQESKEEESDTNDEKEEQKEEEGMADKEEDDDEWEQEEEEEEEQDFVQRNKEEEADSDDEENVRSFTRAMWPDRKGPPRRIHTRTRIRTRTAGLAHGIRRNGRRWTFLETVEAEAGNKELTSRLQAYLKRTYHCQLPQKRRRINCYATLYCTTNTTRPNCSFQLRAQRTDRDRYHLYSSGVHTCKHRGKVTKKSLVKDKQSKEKMDQPEGDEDSEQVEDKEEVNEENEKLDDPIEETESDGGKNEHADSHVPPAIFKTKNGQKWTFAETTITTTEAGGKAFVNLYEEHLKSKYNCFLVKKNLVAKWHTLRHITLNCSTGSRNRCKFKLLAQRTDKGHYHIYTLRKHTCLHGKKATKKSAKVERPEQEDEEEQGMEYDDQKDEDGNGDYKNNDSDKPSCLKELISATLFGDDRSNTIYSKTNNSMQGDIIAPVGAGFSLPMKSPSSAAVTNGQQKTYRQTAKKSHFSNKIIHPLPIPLSSVQQRPLKIVSIADVPPSIQQEHSRVMKGNNERTVPTAAIKKQKRGNQNADEEEAGSDFMRDSKGVEAKKRRLCQPKKVPVAETMTIDIITLDDD